MSIKASNRGFETREEWWFGVHQNFFFFPELGLMYLTPFRTMGKRKTISSFVVLSVLFQTFGSSLKVVVGIEQTFKRDSSVPRSLSSRLSHSFSEVDRFLS